MMNIILLSLFQKIVFSLTSFSKDICPFEGEKISRKKLHDRQILTVSPSGPKSCFKQCSIAAGCLSFNYQRYTLTCELNFSNKITETLVTDDKYDYYENGQFRGGLRGCSEKTCPKNSQCFNIKHHGPHCGIFGCGEPSTVGNATLLPGNNLVGRTRNYTCLTGFLPQGSTSIYCQSNGVWTPSTLYCIETRDCEDVLKIGHSTDGVYSIHRNSGIYNVYCDMEREGWTVFQRRLDGSTNFYRNWSEYVAGFGNLSGDFWLGLDKIYELTSSAINELRIDLEDYTGLWKFAVYSNFTLGAASENYNLNFDTYSGTAGDAMSYSKGRRFATFDHDFNGCAVKHQGAWWYNYCHRSHLNGKYAVANENGLLWVPWHGFSYSLKTTEMKIRRI